MPALETVKPSDVLKLEQNRFIRAPRPRVYEAWTDPEMVRLWFGSAAMQCTSATLDVRVGGQYSINMELRPGVSPESAGGRTRSAVHGEYTKIMPSELLQFTWKPEWSPAEQSLVTVTFQDAAGGTEIKVLHEEFASEISRDGHNTGWKCGLDRLQTLLSPANAATTGHANEEK